MFEAQYLPAGVSVLSPWFPRQGDFLKATVDLVSRTGSGEITVEVATKKKEDPGSGTVVAGQLVSSGIGQDSKQWGPDVLEDLVRYKFTAPIGNWVLFRMLAPVWFDAVEA